MEKAETMALFLLRLGVALSRAFPNDESRVLRILSEAEDHLRQAVAKNRDAGLAPNEAEREAIRQFGSPETVAERFGRELGGVPSPRGLLIRSYVHLGSFVGVLVASAGAAALVLSAAAAVFSPTGVLGAADRPPSYGLPQCWSLTPQYIAAFGPECTTGLLGGPQAAVSHLWLTVGGAAALVAGVGLWGAHRALLWRHMGGWKDQSPPARAHAVLGVLFFGLAGLLLWPISAAAVFSYVSLEPAIGSSLVAGLLLWPISAVAVFSSDAPYEPVIFFSLVAGAPVTAVMFLAYVWNARSVYAQRA